MALEVGYWPVKKDSFDAVLFFDGEHWIHNKSAYHFQSYKVTGPRLREQAEIDEKLRTMRNILTAIVNRAGFRGSHDSIAEDAQDGIRLLDSLSPSLTIEVGKWYFREYDDYPFLYPLRERDDGVFDIIAYSKKHDLFRHVSYPPGVFARRCTESEVEQLRMVCPIGE
jgi:hypothetical protein